MGNATKMPAISDNALHLGYLQTRFWSWICFHC